MAGRNLWIVQAVGDNGASIYYSWNNSESQLGAGNEKLTGTSVGSFKYTGPYQEINRNEILLSEVGDASLTIDFSFGYFSINAERDSSSLTGSGIVDVPTGRIAASGLQLDAQRKFYSTRNFGHFHSK